MQNTCNETNLFLNKYQSYHNNFYIFYRNKRNTLLQQKVVIHLFRSISYYSKTKWIKESWSISHYLPFKNKTSSSTQKKKKKNQKQKQNVFLLFLSLFIGSRLHKIDEPNQPPPLTFPHVFGLISTSINLSILIITLKKNKRVLSFSIWD